jgi:hypothetical protein
MYKLYILVGLIAVINAQFISVSRQDIDHTAGMTENNQNDYIEKAIKGKLTTCIFTCIRNGCGKTFRTQACLFNWKVKINCNTDCQNAANEVKDLWIKESDNLRKNIQFKCTQQCILDTPNSVARYYCSIKKCGRKEGFM